MKEAEEVITFARENKEKMSCVGECGLDFLPHWASSTKEKEEQKEVLKLHAELASELSLSLNVHSRSASIPAINLLTSVGAKRVLLHAFDGGKKAIKRAVNAGFFFSVPPSCVREEQKKELVSLVPLERLCLETDVPCLSPVKGETNRLENILHSLHFISKIKNIPLLQVAQATTKNYKELFEK